jgi:hypothetical protein
MHVKSTNAYCRVSGCSFYQAGDRCSSDEINVNHDGTNAACDTFLPSDVNNSAISNLSAMSAVGSYKFEVGASPVTSKPEALGHARSLNPKIGCSVDHCSRNQNGGCQASAIVINGTGSLDGNRCNMYTAL